MFLSSALPLRVPLRRYITHAMRSTRSPAMLAWCMCLCSLVSISNGTYLQYYNVRIAVDTARALLHRSGITNTADRMAVTMLYSIGFGDDLSGQCFKCSVQYYLQNVGNSTPSDIFIFVKKEDIARMSTLSWIQNANHIFVLPLDENDSRSWKLPPWLRSQDVSAYICAAV